MAIVTLRLNDDEEKILEMLVKHFDEDKSKILKEAMWDKFEELRDRDLIEEYEIKSRANKVQFESADDFVAELEAKSKAKNKGIQIARSKRTASKSHGSRSKA